MAEVPASKRTPRGSCAFGIVSSDPAAREALAGYCAALTSALGTLIYPQVERSYRELSTKLAQGGVDVAWAPPLLAADARANHGATVLASLRRSGSGIYHAAFFARVEDALRDVGALHGKRVAWVDRDSASGYVVPRRWLGQAGHAPDAFFSAEVFGKTHEGTIDLVLRGAADVGATYAVLEPGSRRLLDAGWLHAGARADRLALVATAGVVPPDAIVATKRVDDGLRQRLQAALLGGVDGERHGARIVFHSDGFTQPSSAYLKSLEELVQGPRSER